MGRNPVADEDPPLVSGKLLTMFVLCVVGAAVGAIVMSARAARLHDDAEEQVFAWCGRLDSDKAADKRWRRWKDPTLPELDPWGHALRIRYEEREFGERLTVSSDGPDGKQWTRDDILWTVNNTEWLAMMREGAGAVEDVASAASRGIVGGAIEGVTDHLPKSVRESLGIPGGNTAPTPPPAEKPPQK